MAWVPRVWLWYTPGLYHTFSRPSPPGRITDRRSEEGRILKLTKHESSLCRSGQPVPMPHRLVTKCTLLASLTVWPAGRVCSNGPASLIHTHCSTPLVQMLGSVSASLGWVCISDASEARSQWCILVTSHADSPTRLSAPSLPRSLVRVVTFPNIHHTWRGTSNGRNPPTCCRRTDPCRLIITSCEYTVTKQKTNECACGLCLEPASSA